MNIRGICILIGLLITFSLIATATAGIAYAQSPTAYIKSLGITVPQQPPLAHLAARYILSFRLEKLVNLGPWLLPVVRGADKYIFRTGYPSLPYKVITITLDGYAKNVHVYAEVLSYKIIKVPGRILPGPTPIVWSKIIKAVHEKRFNLTIPRITINTTIYSSNVFYPGHLVKYLVLHGLQGKTLIYVYIAPLQYNPVKKELVLVTKMRLYVTYGAVEKIKFNPRGLLIITNSNLAPYVEKYLVPIYKELGYEVTIVTTEYIYKHFEPAPPILNYLGFYVALYRGSPWVSYLLGVYNYTLALKIISFLRYTLGNYSYLLIVGGAKIVPPSFYYFSPDEFYYVSPYEAWIPTDFFYASPDYDLLPDIYVGRLPFDNPTAIIIYAKKLAMWYQTLEKRKPLIVVGGGYPFVTSYLFGESFLETLIDKGLGKAPIELLTQSEGTFNPSTVNEVLQGKTGAMIFFVMAHGDGFGLWEPILLWFGEYDWEALATYKQLLSYAPSNTTSVVMSIACEDGWWDIDIYPMSAMYWYMLPPKYTWWQALLLSPAGGIAYIGAARTNFDYLWIELLNGRLVADSYGASRALGDVLLAYSSLIGKASNVTLGKIFWIGIASYLREAYAFDPYFALQEAFIHELIGDPTLLLKLPPKPVNQTRIYSVKALNPVTVLDFTSPFWGLPFTAPIFNAYSNGTILVNASRGCYVVEVFRVWNLGIINGMRSLYLLWLEPLTKMKFCVNTTKPFGLARITIPFYEKGISGFVLLRIIGSNYYYRYYMGVLGVKASTTVTKLGAKLSVDAAGLDLLGIDNQIAITVDNRPVATMFIPVSGAIHYTVSLPYLGVGPHFISINVVRTSLTLGYPIYGFAWPTPIPWPGPTAVRNIEILSHVLSAPITTYATKPLYIVISTPSVTEVGKSVDIMIATLVNGKPVNATLKVSIVTPFGKVVELKASQISSGTYRVTFTPKEVGTYTIIVQGAVASATKLNVVAYGYASRSFVATEKFLNLASYVTKVVNTSAQMVVGRVKATVTGATLFITSNITSRLNEVEKVLSSTIAQSSKSLANKISSLETSVTNALTSMSTSISSKIEALSSQISSSIGKVENSIKSLQSSLATSMSSIQTSLKNLNTRISSVSSTLSSLSTKISSFQSTVNEKLSSLSNELSNSVTKIVDKISSAQKSLSNQISSSAKEISSKVSGVEASLKPVTIAATALAAISVGLIAATLAIVVRKPK